MFGAIAVPHAHECATAANVSYNKKGGGLQPYTHNATKPKGAKAAAIRDTNQQTWHAVAPTLSHTTTGPHII